jgi:hypothetical protein
MSKETFITLKEASKISGFAPDYVGQLIRMGKIPGKQVYSNVAWVTTENAVLDYLQKKGESVKAPLSWRNMSEHIRRLQVDNKYEQYISKIFKVIVYLATFLLVLFGLLLFYIFSVTLDKHLDQRASQTTAARL